MVIRGSHLHPIIISQAFFPISKLIHSYICIHCLSTFTRIKRVLFQLRRPNQESAKYLNREWSCPRWFTDCIARSRLCNQLTANIRVKLFLFRTENHSRIFSIRWYYIKQLGFRSSRFHETDNKYASHSSVFGLQDKTTTWAHQAFVCDTPT